MDLGNSMRMSKHIWYLCVFKWLRGLGNMCEMYGAVVQNQCTVEEIYMLWIRYGVAAGGFNMTCQIC